MCVRTEELLNFIDRTWLSVKETEGSIKTYAIIKEQQFLNSSEVSGSVPNHVTVDFMENLAKLLLLVNSGMLNGLC